MVSAVRGRQGSGKVERRRRPGLPEGAVCLTAHIYRWQEGKGGLVDEDCACRGSAVRLHSPPDGERRVVTSGPPFLRHLPCPPQLRHLPCWPLPCHMPPHSSGHRSMQRPGIPRLVGRREEGGRRREEEEEEEENISTSQDEEEEEEEEEVYSQSVLLELR